MQVAPSLRCSVLLAVLVSSGVAAAADVNRWTSIGSTAGGGQVTNSIAFDATGAIYTAGGLGIFKTTDGGASWRALLQEPWRTDPLSYAVGRFVWVDPGAPSTMLASLSPGGVYRTTDAGITWSRVLDGSNFLSMAIAPSSVSTVYACLAVGQGVPYVYRTFKSTDGGVTWTPLDSLGTAAVRALAVDPTSSGIVFAAVGESGSPGPGLYRSTDGGATWTALPAGPPGSSFSAVAIDPGAPATVYAGAFRSSDGGATWTPIDDGLTSLDVQAFAIDPQETSTIYAGTAGGLFRSADRGEHWISLGFHLAAINTVALDPASPSTVYSGLRASLCRITLSVAAPCEPGPETLCLNGGCFRVETTWRDPTMRVAAPARAVPITQDTGYFWFYDAANVEIVVKVLDGTSVNGDFWVFYGALSNLEYVITVTDCASGSIQSYVNNFSVTLASVADTHAFPGAVSAGTAIAPPPISLVVASPASVCIPDPVALCLEDGRFQVRVDWQGSPMGPSSGAAAVGLTGDTGYFWFFEDSNVELVVKVLDGTAINGHYWVFYGALSDVQYAITVTDTQTGATQRYENPQGTLASVADTKAF